MTIEVSHEYIEDYKRRKENKKLIETFPFLKPPLFFDGEVSYYYDYDFTMLDDMPIGWRKKFGIKMCYEILDALKKSGEEKEYQIYQIKEKFGELRVYGNLVNVEVDKVIKEYMWLSRKTCCNCGAEKPFDDLNYYYDSPLYCENCKKKLKINNCRY